MNGKKKRDGKRKGRSTSLNKAEHNSCGQLNPKALAITLGGLWGAYVFLLGMVLTVAPNLRFFWISKELLQMLATLYPGYAATLQGSFIGLFWAVICGSIGGALIAWLHNLALKKCEKRCV